MRRAPLLLLSLLHTLGCEPAPILLRAEDGGTAGTGPAAGSSSGGPASGREGSGPGSSSAAEGAGPTSASASSSVASASSAPADSSGDAPSSSADHPTPLQGDLAFPVRAQASFFHVHDSGLTSEFRIWMGDVETTCPEVVHAHAQRALHISVGIPGGAQQVTPGSYPVVPRGAVLEPMQPYASVWGWWDPPSGLSYPAVSGTVELTHASTARVAGTLEVMMDRLDGTTPGVLRGTFDTACVQPLP